MRSNKILFFNICLFFLLICFVYILIADQDGARLEFEEESHDFGEVSSDTLLEHIFKFKNTGSDTLHIIRVRSG